MKKQALILFILLITVKICFSQWTQIQVDNKKWIHIQFLKDRNSHIGYMTSYSSGTLYKTVDGGINWVDVWGSISPLQIGDVVTSFSFTKENIFGLLIGNTSIIKTFDGGKTWMSDTYPNINGCGLIDCWSDGKIGIIGGRRIKSVAGISQTWPLILVNSDIVHCNTWELIDIQDPLPIIGEIPITSVTGAWDYQSNSYILYASCNELIFKSTDIHSWIYYYLGLGYVTYGIKVNECQPQSALAVGFRPNTPTPPQVPNFTEGIYQTQNYGNNWSVLYNTPGIENLVLSTIDFGRSAFHCDAYASGDHNYYSSPPDISGYILKINPTINQWVIDVGTPTTGAGIYCINFTNDAGYAVGDHQLMKLESGTDAFTSNYDVNLDGDSKRNIHLSGKNYLLRIYPNPVNKFLNIEFTPDGVLKEKRIMLFSSQGVLLKKITDVPHEERYSIDIENYSEGLYLLVVDFGDTILKQNIIRVKL